jgi:tetratricopeptide (TPR) repeat protein
VRGAERALPGARAAAGGLLFAHLALSPVVFSHATTDVFEFNKVALLLLAVVALAALGAVRLPPPRTLAREPLALGVVLFAGSAVASTLGSLSRWTSLAGDPESFAGLPTVLAQVGLFLATRTLCRTPAEAHRLLLAPVLGAAIASAYAALQVAGLDPLPWTRAASFGGTVRPFSTLAHPNFLGAYLAMALPLVAVLGLQRRTLVDRGPFALVGLLALLGIAASLSRAAWAALAAALLVLALGASALGRRREVLRWGLLLLLVVPVGLAVLWWAQPEAGGLPALLAERTQRLADPGARHHLWLAAWRIFLDAPLLGCGLDAFALAFQRHRAPAYWLLEWNTTPYRAHSDGLHVLATQGLLGVGALAVMAWGLGVAGRRAWRRARLEDRPLLLALVAGVAAWCVQGLFGFTVTATGSLLVTFAGVLSGLGGAEEEDGEAPAPWPVAPALVLSGGLAVLVLAANFLTGPWTADLGTPDPLAALVLLVAVIGWVLIGALRTLPSSTAPAPPAGGRWVRVGAWVVAALVAYVLVLRPYQASREAHRGDLLLVTAPEEAAAAFARAVALDPTRDLYLVRQGAALQAAAGRATDAAERTRRLSEALAAFQRAVALVPADARHRASLGALLTEFAALGMALPAQVYAAYDEALARDPHNANFSVHAANAALRLGDGPTALRYASRAAELYPRFGPPRAQLGYLALTEGRNVEAATLLREALAGEWHGDQAAWVAASVNLAAALLALGELEEARQRATEAVEAAPESVNAHFLLGRVLERLGAREEALGHYRRVLALQPDHAQARDALGR